MVRIALWVAVMLLPLLGPIGLAVGGEKKVDPVVGTYHWYTGAEFVIRADGTATAKLADKTWAVRWVANPYGGYILMYDEGGVDIVKLSRDFTRLEGTGVSEGKSYPVSGARRE